MAYAKQTWTDGISQANAARLGHIETGIEDAAADADTANAGLATKAEDSTVVHDTGNETVAGIKTFSSAPVVPDASWTVAKTNGLQGALDAKYDALADLPISIAVDLMQASNGTWPSAAAIESTRRVSWRGYPGLSNPPAMTGRPAGVSLIDEYVLKTT